nr:hypothetical protein Q903MT_gene2137 [Picea sitchensis]
MKRVLDKSKNKTSKVRLRMRARGAKQEKPDRGLLTHFLFRADSLGLKAPGGGGCHKVSKGGVKRLSIIKP